MLQRKIDTLHMHQHAALQLSSLKRVQKGDRKRGTKNVGYEEWEIGLRLESGTVEDDGGSGQESGMVDQLRGLGGVVDDDIEVERWSGTAHQNGAIRRWVMTLQCNGRVVREVVRWVETGE
jgi:hypothetical protein